MGVSPHRIQRVAAAVVVAAALYFSASPAFAWNVEGMDRKIRIEREVGDGTGTVYVYFSGVRVNNATYMADGTWDQPPATPYYSIVFDTNDTVFEVNAGTFTNALVVTPAGDNAAISTARSAVYLVDPSTGAAPYAQPVTLSGSNSVAISTMPSVSLDSSVSVDGTLPVSVSSILGETDGAVVWSVVGGLCALLAWAGLSHLFGGHGHE